MLHNRMTLGTYDLARLEQGSPRAERRVGRGSQDPSKNEMSGVVGGAKVPSRMLTGRR